jgi:hypothetical protein
MKVEKIYWYDPVGLAEWHSMDSVKQLEPARCVTIAEVIHETDAWIVTSASWSNVTGSDTEFADITVIPKGCITQRGEYPKTRRNK